MLKPKANIAGEKRRFLNQMRSFQPNIINTTLQLLSLSSLHNFFFDIKYLATTGFLNYIFKPKPVLSSYMYA